MDERAGFLGFEFIGLRVLDLARCLIDLFVGLDFFENFFLERFHLEFFGFSKNLEQRVRGGFFIELIGRDSSEMEQGVGGFSDISIGELIVGKPVDKVESVVQRRRAGLGLWREFSNISVKAGLFVMESEIGVFEVGLMSLSWDVNELVEFMAGFSFDFGGQVHGCNERSLLDVWRELRQGYKP